MEDSFYHIFTTNIPILCTLILRLRSVGIHNVISKNYHMSVITLISRKICDKLVSQSQSLRYFVNHNYAKNIFELTHYHVNEKL
jgi:hypothetical protein